MLILIVGSASLSILLEKGSIGTLNEPTPNLLWQSDLTTFAYDFVVADGKVFTSDAQGDLHCFDAQSGESLWSKDVSDYSHGSRMLVYGDKLYFGSKHSVVKRLDLNTGAEEMSYQAPVWTSYASKGGPADFFVADGKVFAIQNGIAVYDESTGELFWKSNMMGVVELGNASAPESNYVFTRSHFRINPNNGSIIWSIPGRSSGTTEVNQGKVLLWNYNPAGSSDEAKDLLCVNASSGEELWRFYVGTRMFQPIVSNGMVLFGAEDGCLYSVDFEDGSLKWKTPADDQNTPVDVLDVTAFYVQVNAQNQRVFWSITARYSETGPENGTMLSLDLSDGDRIWIYNVANETSWNFVGATFSNNILYVAAGNNLYCLGANTGTIKLTENFEHYIHIPIVVDDKVFVVADLWLFAYE